MIWPFAEPGPTIGPMRSDHAAAAARLHARCFAHGWTEPDLTRLVGEANCIGHAASRTRTGELTGFVLSRCAADEAEILTIAVDPRFRRRGIARDLLMIHLPALSAIGAKTLFLEVEDGNTAAKTLYEAFGFLPVGRREGYYRKADGSRAGAVVMRRDLD